MATNSYSKADVLYRRIIRNTFFSQGWGAIDMYRSLQRLKRDMFDPEKFKELVSSETVKIDKVNKVVSKSDSYSVLDGHFVSPLVNHSPRLLPKESEVARFQATIPCKRPGGRIPMCIQLAGTGDHRYWRRRNLVAKPLLRENGIGSVILVNPYYGCRKPETQTRSSLNCVLDLFVMGCALIVETSVLLAWCEKQGFGPLAVAGVSMGGHMASLAATFVPKAVAVVPCLSWTTASSVFTEGVLSNAVAWHTLEKQLEDVGFFEALKDVCHLVKADGLRARNSLRGDTNVSSLSSLSDEILGVNICHENLTMQPSMDYQLNFSSKDHMSENCQSVSLEMLAGSLKNQIKNDIKHNVSSKFSYFKSRSHLNKCKKNENAKKFMKYIMDITTHLAYYRTPVDPQLAVFIQATFDGYIPRKDCGSPLELWPGCEVKYTNCGHIYAALYKQDVFRKTIAETLSKMT